VVIQDYELYEAYHTIHKTATAQQTGKRHITTATQTANNTRQNFNHFTGTIVQYPSTAAVCSGPLRPGAGHTQSQTGVTITESCLDPIPAFLDLNRSAFQQRINVPCDGGKHLLDVLTRLRRSFKEVEATAAGGKSPTFGLRHCPVLRCHVCFVPNDCIDGLARQQMESKFVKPLVKVLERLTVGNVVHENCSHGVSVIWPRNWPDNSHQQDANSEMFVKFLLKHFFPIRCCPPQR